MIILLVRVITAQINLSNFFGEAQSESFVGTIKRDYVYTSDCVDARTTLRMLKEWFKDYNEIAPHSGLGMMSPMEYKKAN